MIEEIIGLQKGIVRLSPYNPKWSYLYKAEEELLRKTMGSIIVDIQHVGSTSVPGLISKPIIDIAIAVKALADGEHFIEPLEKLGYEYKDDAGIPGRHFFAKGGYNRTHYIHVEELNGKLWYNHILFRDYLKCYPETLAAYAELKIQLAENFC
jgi:GrpB-like predicted nucleotidyltransferase (UPF0157 family)